MTFDPLNPPKIVVIIPAYNEAQSIGLVLAEIPAIGDCGEQSLYR